MEEILAKALELLASASAQATIIAVVVEFVLRLVPSKKPLSIAHAVAAIAKSVGTILVKFAELLDKVLPQKVEAPKE